MNKITNTPRLMSRALAALARVFFCAVTSIAPASSRGPRAQKPPTRACATFTDVPSSYRINSNTGHVTVANVAGLTITPDGGSVPTVVAGQTSVDFTFTVTNSGNFATQVRFPALGAGIVTSGPITVTQAVIDVTGNGLGAGDTDILGNAAPVLYPGSPYLARNASFNVVVRVSVNAGAAAGANISVQLGDASGHNVVANNSAAEVRPSVPPSVTLTGSESEAVGSITTSVENDAQLQVELTVPSGPVALGSNITYSKTLRNHSARPPTPHRHAAARPAAAQRLQNAPAGSNTGVYVVVPIPLTTVLQSVPAP